MLFRNLHHSLATILPVAKIDLKFMSELLGHRSVAITADIYAHVLPEQQQEIVNKMSDLFKYWWALLSLCTITYRMIAGIGVNLYPADLV